MSLNKPANKEELKDFCLTNKYTKWYFDIVDRAACRAGVDGYSERHHVLPKSIKMNDYNVRLSAREHYICHLLLPRMLKEKNHIIKMQLALHRLVHGNGGNNVYCKSSIMYESLKKQHNKAASERSKKMWSDPKYRNNVMESRKNQYITDEDRNQRKIRAAQMGMNNKGKFTGDNHPLRKKGGHTQETKYMMSVNAIKSEKGKGEKNGMFGKTGAATGKKWYHNPVTKVEKYFIKDQQEAGFVPGRLKNVTV